MVVLLAADQSHVVTIPATVTAQGNTGYSVTTFYSLKRYGFWSFGVWPPPQICFIMCTFKSQST